MSSIDESIFQMEMVDMQSSFILKHHLHSGSAMLTNVSTPQLGKWPC